MEHEICLGALHNFSLCVESTEILLPDCLFSLSACREESPVWMSQIWADESHLLRSCRLTNSFILTVKHPIHFDPQRSIQLYRKRRGYLESQMQVSVHCADESNKPACAVQ